MSSSLIALISRSFLNSAKNCFSSQVEKSVLARATSSMQRETSGHGDSVMTRACVVHADMKLQTHV